MTGATSALAFEPPGTAGRAPACTRQRHPCCPPPPPSAICAPCLGPRHPAAPPPTRAVRAGCTRPCHPTAQPTRPARFPLGQPRPRALRFQPSPRQRISGPAPHPPPSCNAAVCPVPACPLPPLPPARAAFPRREGVRDEPPRFAAPRPPAARSQPRPAGCLGGAPVLSPPWRHRPDRGARPEGGGGGGRRRHAPAGRATASASASAGPAPAPQGGA